MYGRGRKLKGGAGWGAGGSRLRFPSAARTQQPSHAASEKKKGGRKLYSGKKGEATPSISRAFEKRKRSGRREKQKHAHKPSSGAWGQAEAHARRESEEQLMKNIRKPLVKRRLPISRFGRHPSVRESRHHRRRWRASRGSETPLGRRHGNAAAAFLPIFRLSSPSPCAPKFARSPPYTPFLLFLPTRYSRNSEVLSAYRRRGSCGVG